MQKQQYQRENYFYLKKESEISLRSLSLQAEMEYIVNQFLIKHKFQAPTPL